MANMATMPIYGKTLKNLLLWNQKADDQVCSNDDPGLTLTYFKARSNLVPLYGKKVEQRIFQKLFKLMIPQLVDTVN